MKTDEARVRDWLVKKLRLDARLCRLAALVLVPAGLCTMFLQVLVFFGLIWIAFGRWFGFAGPSWLLAVAAVAGTVVWQWRLRPEPPEVLLVSGPGGRRDEVGISPHAGYGFEVVLTGTDTDRFSLVWWRNLALLPARLLFGAATMWRTGRAIDRTDRDTLARVVHVLVCSGGKVAFWELCGECPTMDPTVVLPQMRRLEGIVFLRGSPPGVSIARHLTEEIQASE